MNTIRLHVFLLLLVLGYTGTAAAAMWERQAFGQLMYYCGHENDPGYAFHWPDNNNWSQQKQTQDNVALGCTTVTQPSNWDTATYPGYHTQGSDDAVISGTGGPTTLDRFASSSGAQSATLFLHNLTVIPAGTLGIQAGAIVSASFYNFQTSNDADALLSVADGGGGAWPKIIIPAEGTMKKTIGTSTYQLDGNITLEAINGGTIACDAGALQLPANGTYYFGPSHPTLTPIHFDAATGASIDLAPANGTVLVGGYITGINTGGAVRLNKGKLTTRTSNGGAGGVTWNFLGDTFQWQGGTIDSVKDGNNFFTNVGVMNITGPGSSITGNGFTNHGSLIQSGTGVLNLPSGSTTTSTDTGVIDFRNDNGITVNGGSGAAPVFNSSGTIRKSGGTGNLVIDSYLLLQNIGGTVEVDTGTLSLGHGLTARFGIGNGGTLIVAAGATLQLNDGTSDALYNGVYTASGGGTILLAGGNIYSDDQVATGYTFNFREGIFHWTGGTINTGTPFFNTGYISLLGSGGINGYRFNNNGTITQSGAGMLNIPSGSVLINGADGTYDIQNDLGMTNNGGGGQGPRIDNAGLFTKSAGTGTDTIAASLVNTGTVLIASGTLAFDHFTQTAGVLDLAGGNLSSPNSDITINGGIVRGNGTITGHVRNNTGTFSPGHSPGTITINGNYTQGSGGTLNIEIGGTAAGAFDQLVVNGTATLGGTLNVSFINGFRPQLGDVYTFIVPTSVSGSFSQVTGGAYGVSVNYASGALTVTVTGVPPILQNISTRMKVLTDDKVLIAGFIITGSDSKKVLVRGLGPSLPVSGALQDPTLGLFSGATQIAANDDWRTGQEQEIEDTTIPPSNDLESALVQSLAPGGYTAVLSGNNSATGIGLVEVYDLSTNAHSQLANISTRGFVDTDDNVMIGGVIVGGGSAASTTKVLVRAIGPSLAAANVNSTLQDPMLEFRDANGQLVAQNDDWRSTQEQAIKDTTIPPSDDRESAIVQTVGAGNYTAVVRGKNGTTGVALVELYSLQ